MQHRLHHGNIECPVCYHSRHWGNIGSPDQYIRFLHCISCDDFFCSAGGSLDACLGDRPADFFDFFLNLMDRKAEETGSKYWAVKFDMLFLSFPHDLDKFLERIHRRYGRPPAIVSIQRPWKSQLASYLKMEGPYHQAKSRQMGKLAATILGLARYRFYNNRIHWLIRKVDGLAIQFREMTDPSSEVLSRISGYLDVDSQGFDQSSLPTPNTSFSGSTGTSDRNPKHGVTTTLLYHLMGLPFLAGGVVQVFERLRKLPSPVSTRILEERYYPHEFRARMESEGAHGLLEGLPVE